MFAILVSIAFVGLMIKLLILAFKLTWNLAKVVASILMALALPLLLVCIFFWGGITLLAPVGLLCIAFGLLKSGR